MPYFSSILHAPLLLCTISSIWKPNVLFFSLVRTAELWTSMSASYRMDKDYSLSPPMLRCPVLLEVDQERLHALSSSALAHSSWRVNDVHNQ